MSRLLEMVSNALGLGSSDSPRVVTESCIVFARIQESLKPMQRGRKYEEPLNRALVGAGLGTVTGGGSVQGTDGSIEWVSLDMRLRDLDGALDFARAKLRALGAPRGSVLKFRDIHGVATIPIHD